MASIPEGYADLFERPSHATLCTLTPDGYPHVTPVWIDADDDTVLVNTARGRRKVRNVSADPRVGVAVIDPENFYRYLSVWGEVTALREDGAVKHIHELSHKYTGESYQNLDEEDAPRVVMEITPEHVISKG